MAHANHHHAENNDNKILRLFDPVFTKKFFTERILPIYPDFDAVKKVEIRPIKKFVWRTTYHVVIEYDAIFKTKGNGSKILPIFCTAHSNEQRKNVYDVLRYLWDNGFSHGYLTIPHPLIYSNYYKAVFYRGVRGSHLLHFIKLHDLATVEKVVMETAAWLAKLHALPTRNMKNFNQKSNRIETAIPGRKKITEEIGHRHSGFLGVVNAVYNALDEKEKNFLSSTGKRWLVHGDAHPENVIIVGRKKIAMIDFTDFCLSDFARDLGSFMQQLDYMCSKNIPGENFTQRIKKIFWIIISNVPAW